ncbi:hypothetical protein KL86PLE_100105 [uncultured Pleomorphomonas sp.]|uniref:Uncharacterized protein n=1 Tax=uncultured Pleomorphomonas sp. TaxID=442121 RepID=A0A212L1D2_9HYPH|nr:hypothetical protein KL86PLE_100105 [uncultured Pleomorphomonas sp.]
MSRVRRRAPAPIADALSQSDMIWQSPEREAAYVTRESGGFQDKVAPDSSLGASFCPRSSACAEDDS